MTEWLQRGMPHLIVVPIVLPLATAALMVLLPTARHRGLRAGLGVAASGAGLAVALALLAWTRGHDAAGAAGAIGVYLPSNWPVPFGIVLAVDRLAALMLVLAAFVGLAAALASVARRDAAGLHFHPFLQIQLMGLNGAFLTADLFDLFVFFEVLLAASYGLLLHGSGTRRVRAGLHYIAVNLLASALFLVGATLLYGVTGTLNLADMAQRAAQVADADRGLLHAGAAILAIAFLTKAAMWPLNFWLAPAYAAAAAPAAALFAILTKVGLYAVLRVWTLLFATQADAAAMFGAQALVGGGLATLAVGAVGMLASHGLGRMAGHAIVVSSGTVLAAIGLAQPALTGAALYYLLSSTLAVAALYLLREPLDRARPAAPSRPVDDRDTTPFFADLPGVDRDVNLDDDERAIVGRTIPASMTFLGLGFVACALLIAGLPPLSGFVGKFAMLSALLGASHGTPPVTPAGWTLMALLLASGLLSMIALSRAGIRCFWTQAGRAAPRLRWVEALPIAALLGGCVLLTVQAGVAMRDTQAAADALHRPARYVEAILSTLPRPGPSSAGAP